MKKLLIILLFLTTIINAQFLELMQGNNKELNPNPNFSNWNYVDLLSGWNFTSGWTAAASTIIDNNSFSTSSGGGVHKAIGLVSNETYVANYSVNTTASTLNLRIGTSTPFQIVTAYLASNTQSIFTVNSGLSNNSCYFQNGSSGVTDFNSISIKKLVAPTGWTASTMNATNYVLQDNGCKFVEAIGETYIETLGNVKAGTRKIKVEQDWTQGKLYITNGVTSVALPQSDGFTTVTMSFNSSQKLKVTCDNNTISILKQLSIK